MNVPPAKIVFPIWAKALIAPLRTFGVKFAGSGLTMTDCVAFTACAGIAPAMVMLAMTASIVNALMNRRSLADGRCTGSPSSDRPPGAHVSDKSAEASLIHKWGLSAGDAITSAPKGLHRGP